MCNFQNARSSPRRIFCDSSRHLRFTLARFQRKVHTMFPHAHGLAGRFWSFCLELQMRVHCAVFLNSPIFEFLFVFTPCCTLHYCVLGSRNQLLMPPSHRISGGCVKQGECWTSDLKSRTYKASADCEPPESGNVHSRWTIYTYDNAPSVWHNGAKLCGKPPPNPPSSSSPVIVAILPGIGGGFFYLMCTGEVLALPSPTGFEERYVLLDDASFFEVSGPLGAQGKECAARLRGVFRARAGVLRVAYAASLRSRSVEAMARQVKRRTWPISD